MVATEDVVRACGEGRWEVVVGLLEQLRGELDGEARKVALAALSIAMQVAVIGLVQRAAPAVYRRRVHQLARCWVADLTTFGARAVARVEWANVGQRRVTRIELNAGRPGVAVEVDVEAMPAFGAGEFGAFRHMNTIEVEAWQHAQG